MIRATDWMDLAFDSWRLGVEASSVVALRLTRLAAGDAAALAEAQLMIGEKIEAAAALQMRALTGGLGATHRQRARATIAHYRKAVRRNRRRLRRR
jgi:hypothetical protein